MVVRYIFIWFSIRSISFHSDFRQPVTRYDDLRVLPLARRISKVAVPSAVSPWRSSGIPHGWSHAPWRCRSWHLFPKKCPVETNMMMDSFIKEVFHEHSWTNIFFQVTSQVQNDWWFFPKFLTIDYTRDLLSNFKPSVAFLGPPIKSENVQLVREVTELRRGVIWVFR